jgi:hypothetical protein
MSVLVICPVCDRETEDPTPEWVQSGEVVEVCSECEAEWYADPAAMP